MLPKSELKVHPHHVTERLQQKKPGINQILVSGSNERFALASWIKENICKKECCFFEKDASGADVCKCGYSKTDHTDEAIKPEDFAGESWNMHKHIREVPTDAFGDISFGSLGQKTGKVRRFLLSILMLLCVNARLQIFAFL